MKKILYTVSLLFGFTLIVNGQTGEIQGKVIDDKGAPVAFAAVVIVQDEAGLKPTSKGAKTDLNGFYTIKGVNPGTYNLRASFTGKPKVVESGVTVFVGRPTTQNFKLEERSTTVGTVTIKAKRTNPVKLIDVFAPVQSSVTAEQVKQSSVRDVNTLASQAAGVLQNDRGKEVKVAGGRDGDNVFFVDGVKVTGSAQIPPSSIQSIEAMTVGIPAKYGDATGGVFSITTKGPTDRVSVTIDALSSQYLDPYGFNAINGSLSMPIFRRKADTSFLEPGKKKPKGESVFGMYTSIQYKTEGDRSPRLKGNYKIKDDVFNDLRNNPYQLDATGNAIVSRQLLITKNDIEEIDAHQNTGSKELNGTLKFDWKVNKLGTNITVSGTYYNEQYHDFIDRYSLLNYENNPEYDAKTYTGLLRWYQPLYNPNSEKQAKKLFRNASFQLQADISRNGTNVNSPVGGFNPWLYGYIGKFEELLTPNATLNSGVFGPYKVFYGEGANDYVSFGPHVLVSNTTPNGVLYSQGSTNRTAAIFTDSFIKLHEREIGKLTSVNSMNNAGALVNGTRADKFLHNLFYPMARVYNGIQKQENEQFRVSGNLNFDLINKKSADLNKHTIEIGFELEKRYQRSYTISPNSLWAIAQVSLNQHLAVANDKNYNPLLIMKDTTMRLSDYIRQLQGPNPITFNSFDTIFYDKEVSNGSQTNFSKNFRSALGYDSLTRVNIHEIAPEKLDLKMFSPDDLMRSSIAPGCEGYDVYGNQVANDASFQNFFKEKQNGNYTRKVAPIQPFYAAGYIQDRFQLKDIAFNVGLRADYYNPNAYVFRDPYIPSGGRTISEVKNLGLHPTNLPSDASVYVNNATNPTSITGYRAGDQWYDTKGKELNGSASIEVASGGQVLPYLRGNTIDERAFRDMKDEKFVPDSMFRSTSGNVNIMPRLNFTFKIDTNALLFAQYDMVSRRPNTGLGIPTGYDYYNMFYNGAGSVQNANLKSPRTSILGLGFKQKLSVKSTLTINFKYTERIDYEQLINITGAYPFNYQTYGNVDFGTVKSIELVYELRRTNNLRMTVKYMMQFAEGTGSSSSSSAGLLAANQGNLKLINPLNEDNRHNLALNANYEFPGGSYYNGPSKLKWLFQEMGLTFDAFLRSGAPYTQQSNITPTQYLSGAGRAVTLGDINSGQMPWRINVNLKLYKDFSFKYGKKPKDSVGLDERRMGSLNLYINVNNLLGTQVLSVFRYTGAPDNDGYLGSPEYQTQYLQNEATAKGSGQSFRDLYNVALQMSNSYALPRTIQMGAILSF